MSRNDYIKITRNGKLWEVSHCDADTDSQYGQSITFKREINAYRKAMELQEELQTEYGVMHED